MIHDKSPARGEGGHWGRLYHLLERVCAIFKLLDHAFFALL